MADISQTHGKSLRFDFNEAVALARRDFPEETKNVTFIDLDAPDVEARMQNFYDSLSPREKQECGARRDENPDFLTAKAMPTVWHTTEGKKLLVSYGRRQLLNEVEKIANGAIDLNTNKHYTFWHELAHVVVKGADRAGSYAEHAADSFAIMRGFQSGFLTKKDAVAIADGRDMLCWFNADITHLTSMSIDALVINPKHTDFMSLTPRETAALAVKHAQTFSLNADISGYARMTRATNVWNWTMGDMRQDRLANLAQVVATSDKGSLPFYYAARLLFTARERKQAGDPLLEKVDMSGEAWDKAFAVIDKAAVKRDIAARKALDAPDGDQPQSALQKLRTRLKPLSI